MNNLRRIDIMSKALNLSLELDDLFLNKEHIESSKAEVGNKEYIVYLINKDIDSKLLELEKLKDE